MIGVSAGGHTKADYSPVPFIGINAAQALETATGDATFYGGSDEMVLRAKWMG